MSTKSDKSKRKKSIKPTYMKIRGQKHEAKNWAKCLRILLVEAYKHAPATFNSMPDEQRMRLGIYTGKEEIPAEKAKKLTKIANSNLYVYVMLALKQSKDLSVRYNSYSAGLKIPCRFLNVCIQTARILPVFLVAVAARVFQQFFHRA